MNKINEIEVDALKQFADTVASNAAQGMAQFQVMTDWSGGTKSTSSVQELKLGDQRLARDMGPNS
ncbi:hypothetical protein [Paenibacillus gorillae]|uniref:hypothetical protein n=1 Tax=Paenibacillus gorillae TaxID=1243662 RepID=UPI0004B87266|nr:hypothetical protein [Paenibacillus gorillae]